MTEPTPPVDAVREDPPVTLSVTRRVRPGREREFEEFLRGLTETTSKFPGYLGTQIFRPPRGEREFRVVFSFDRESNLHAWKESEERRAWNAIGDELAEEPPRYANITGTAQEQRLALALTPLQGFVQTSVSGIGLLLLGHRAGAGRGELAAGRRLRALLGDRADDRDRGVRHLRVAPPLGQRLPDGALLLHRRAGDQARGVGRRDARAAPGGAADRGRGRRRGGAGGDLRAAQPGRPGATGWGIPMATDTAFALGMITLFGGRVRPLLLVFLTAFSIVDDIVAVLVIAVFYTEAISWPALGVAGLLLGGLFLANRAGFHRWPVYAFGGFAVWLAVFESGVHGHRPPGCSWRWRCLPARGSTRASSSSGPAS
jgi:NhaA family Na+:H+ antiporter